MHDADAHPTREIRTYLSFSLPIDPAKVFSLTDMDISYALASTLVELDDTKQIAGGIASRWTLIGDRTYRFHLRRTALWSDGSKIQPQQIKASFERAKLKHGGDLKDVFSRIASIETTSDDTIDFHLNAAD